MLQACRNPSRATTKSHAGVRVQRQPVRSSRHAAETHLFGYTRSAVLSPSRIADVPIQSASCRFMVANAPQYSVCALVFDAAHRTVCVRTSRTSAHQIAKPAEMESRGKPRPTAECQVRGQLRHAWSDEAAQRNKSNEKAIRLAECGRAFAKRSRVSHGLAASLGSEKLSKCCYVYARCNGRLSAKRKEGVDFSRTSFKN